MFKVKIYGAGSIGNHLSNASRTMGWAVDLCDLDPAALERTRTQIYPSRYGKWDDAIRLFTSDQAPSGGYDLIVIGTPPDSHILLAMAAIKEKPRAILVEKPFCAPDMRGAQELFEATHAAGIAVFTGYDHVVGQASGKFAEVAASGRLGVVETLDVEFREFWGGIFAAHPWLAGPSDTYLGFWKRGGGASGEQRQRIAIARALYDEANLLVLDEATSALDNVSERSVQEAIERLRGRVAMVTIAHRLSTVRNCDRIFVVDGGKLVASGTYEALLDTNPLFRSMVEAAERTNGTA